MFKNPVLYLLFLCISCKSDDTLFELLSASETGVDFKNTLVEDEENNVLNYEYFYNGGGVAVADFDNDGLTDIYFTGNQLADKLYLNKGDLSFEDITEKAGISHQNGEWKTGVSVVDINQDGWMDIYVCLSNNETNPERRKNKLYINNKNLTFTENAESYGLAIPSFTTMAGFVDFDQDGDLDCYLLNHNVEDFNRFDADFIRKQRDPYAGDMLLENNDGKFTDISEKAGIKGNPLGFGLGLQIADLNQDGWPDIYVSNDYIENDYLYINNQDGTFTDKIKEMTGHTSYFSMGSDIADINNDLLPDIFTLDMLPESNERQKLLFGPDNYEAYLSMIKNDYHVEIMRNMLHLNNGNGTFSEIGQVAGVSNTDWSWASLFADYDNDGNKDLFVTNGYLRDYTNNDFIKYYSDQRSNSNGAVLDIIKEMPSSLTSNYIFQNNGNLSFTDKTKEWGIERPINSNGAVYADLDNDGDLEIIVNNNNEVASIYKNLQQETEVKNFLSVKLNATASKCEGAKLIVYQNNQQQLFLNNSVRGFQSSISSPIHVGLGTTDKIDSLVIMWADGFFQKVVSPKINASLTIEYQPENKFTENLNAPLFKASETLNFVHQQLPFNDFRRQLTLPQMYSYAGPTMAIGDINRDGLDDIYVGGGKGQAGKLFLQNKSGNFVSSTQTAFSDNTLSTDTDAVFFDVDNDNDLDLYVTSGGYEYLIEDLLLKNRLYINDGSGNFSKEQVNDNAQLEGNNVVEAFDFDNDGDTDIFVGGSVIPGNYPGFYPSRFYRNDNGVLIENTTSDFSKIGLITGATSGDFDKDGRTDLIIVGEWTGVLYFKNTGSGFKKENIGNATGLFQSVISGDMDNDGDLDLIVGNFGLNSQYKASAAEPVQVHVKDFDGNGRIDPLISTYVQGVSYPAYSLDEITAQLPSLRKTYNNYASYSKANTTDILKVLGNEDVLTYEANTLETLLFINENGTFKQSSLPIEIQFSPVNALLLQDINGDGLPDLITGGNQSNIRVRTGKIDASYGQVFINKGNGKFQYLIQKDSGISVKGDVRSVVWISDQLIFGINSGDARAFKPTRTLQ
jgi:hypothetical protein